MTPPTIPYALHRALHLDHSQGPSRTLAVRGGPASFGAQETAEPEPEMEVTSSEVDATPLSLFHAVPVHDGSPLGAEGVRLRNPRGPDSGCGCETNGDPKEF